MYCLRASDVTVMSTHKYTYKDGFWCKLCYKLHTYNCCVTIYAVLNCLYDSKCVYENFVHTRLYERFVLIGFSFHCVLG